MPAPELVPGETNFKDFNGIYDHLPVGVVFAVVRGFSSERNSLSKYPVRLILNDAQAPCGCKFGYKHGFKIVCEFHIAERLAISAKRVIANQTIHRLWPEVTKSKPRKKLKADSPESLAAFRAEIARRTEIARKERAKIKKPTRKLTKREREHLHTFAFTAEQVRKEVLG